ncbi:autotransporter outer membrane beta-barrel domain-containing protein [Bartonella raoultii]|uniref:Autotransporter outer membrane beta-barrel domain-containing protein n=1 Tax=Bartonella raoultii TaxID=1457020 RepID=A0ABS7I3P1_9HYPH|nr:autotransporter outer membrane beta-barrel domain-containing protein [Bartonella raoultii]MBX4335205.1 autotransporter outer membrane beta-barrel domain-containing protein [Bartonella raoultii]
MHKKSLLFYTATCALFFSYFNGTYISNASGLNPQTRSAREDLIHLPHQDHHALEFVNTPTQATAILSADNQGFVDIARKQGTRQDNRDWDKQHNQEDIRHKTVSIESTLQGQKKELSNSFSNAFTQTWNTDTRTKMQLPQLSLHSSEEQKPSLIGSKIKAKRSLDQSPSNHSVSQQKAPSSQTKVQDNLPSKDDSTNQITTESTDSSDETLASKAEAPTPQIAHYLLMPHAMLATGFSDVNNQSALLDSLRITMFEPKNQKERGSFLSVHGDRITLSSFLQSAPKSYNANIDYHALQTSVTLMTLEEPNISTNFGLFGTYGKLAFAPKNKNNIPEKKMFNKWSLTAYGDIQHDSGIYASAFLFYGIFKDQSDMPLMENIKKNHDTKTLGASATVGQKLETGFEGIILEPQAQLVYQRLIFGLHSENKDFKVNMGHPHQWWLRLGGRVTRNTGNALSFYGKLNFIKTFEDSHSIEIDKPFQVTPMGTSIEGGLGIHSYLLPNIALHGDISYQYKLKESIVSGLHFSAGIRYRF